MIVKMDFQVLQKLMHLRSENYHSWLVDAQAECECICNIHVHVGTRWKIQEQYLLFGLGMYKLG